MTVYVALRLCGTEKFRNKLAWLPLSNSKSSLSESSLSKTTTPSTSIFISLQCSRGIYHNKACYAIFLQGYPYAPLQPHHHCLLADNSPSVQEPHWLHASKIPIVSWWSATVLVIAFGHPSTQLYLRGVSSYKRDTENVGVGWSICAKDFAAIDL